MPPNIVIPPLKGGDRARHDVHRPRDLPRSRAAGRPTHAVQRGAAHASRAGEERGPRRPPVNRGADAGDDCRGRPPGTTAETTVGDDHQGRLGDERGTPPPVVSHSADATRIHEPFIVRAPGCSRSGIVSSSSCATWSASRMRRPPASSTCPSKPSRGAFSRDFTRPSRDLAPSGRTRRPSRAAGRP